MANKKVSELTAYTTPVSGDVLPINDAANTTTKKVTIDNLFNILSSLFRIKDSSDTTKKVAFDVSGVTTATTRTITIPDANTTMVGTDVTQTLSGKTLTSPVINVTSDATGDIYYRNAGGAFTRLAIGTANYVLRVVGGIPAWSAETALSDASTTVKGVVEAATSSEVTAGTATGGTGAVLVVTPDALAASTPVFNGSGLTNLTAVTKLTQVTTDVAISSTTTETTLVSQSITGGTLSTSNGVRVKLYFSALNITASNSCTIRFKYGATTMMSITPTTDVTFGAATGCSGWAEFTLLASGATNSQNVAGAMAVGTSSFKIGNAGGTQAGFQSGNTYSAQGTATEDSTANKTLAITAQFSNSGASDNLTMTLATVEILK